jgi:hypothetical protein
MRFGIEPSKHYQDRTGLMNDAASQSSLDGQDR